MTQQTRTNIEHLQALTIDNVSGIVYNADELMESQRSRQAYYINAKPSKHPTVTKVVQNWLKGILLPLRNGYASVVAGTQTRLRKEFNVRRLHTRLRKGKLNSLEMRKSCSLKEKQYGKKLNG